MLDFCSSFLNKQCYFGCYPNPAQFNELVENDIKYFIDLFTFTRMHISNLRNKMGIQMDQIEAPAV